VAFPIPQPDAPPEDLNKEFANYIREFSDVVEAHGKAIFDRRIKRGEVEELRREVKELVRQALTYLAAIEKAEEVL
jgi:Mg2+ and Co2+ transporter CorA